MVARPARRLAQGRDRHQRPRRHRTATAACSASRSTPTSRPTATSTCSTRTTTDRVAPERREDRAADADQGRAGRHAWRPRPRDGPPRHDRRRAVSRRRPTRRRLHAVDQQLAHDRHRARGPRRDAVGRQRATARATPRRTRRRCAPTTSSRCPARSSTSTATAAASRATRSAPASRTSTSSARSSTRRASATRSASSCGRAPGPIVGDVGWDATEEVNLIAAGEQLRLALLRGPRRRRPATRTSPSARRTTTTDPPARHAAGLRLQPRTASGGGAVVVGPAVHRHALPAAYRGAWFFGDYVQGWLRIYDVVGRADRRTCGRSRPTGFDGVDLELTPEGDLAYLRFTRRELPDSGRLERIVYGNAPPPAVAHATPASGRAPLDGRRSAPTSRSTPTATPSPTRGTSRATARRTPAAAPRRTSTTTAGVYTATLTVRDARGLAERGPRWQVRVDVTPPVATIEAPGRRRAVPPRHPGCAARARPPTPRTATLDRRAARSGASCCTTAATSTSSGPSVHGAEQTLHARRRPRRRLLLRDPADRDRRRRATRTRETVEIRPETIPLTLASSPPGVPLSYSGREYARAHGADRPRSATARRSRRRRRSRATARSTASRAGPTAARACTTSSCPAADRTLTATLRRRRRPRRRRRRGAPAAGPGSAATAPRAAAAPRPSRPPRADPERAGDRARHRAARARSRCARPARTGAAATGTRARAGSASATARCSSSVWMRAKVTAAGPSAWRWRLRLHGALRRGRYVVASRVTDQARSRAARRSADPAQHSLS